MDDEDDEDDENEFEPKLVSSINCISHVEVKEEVIVPEDTSDGESTLSDNEKNPYAKLEECIICCKYRSMFIILRNHDCSLENDEKCKYCTEIFHWSTCFKNHRDSHQIKKESDHSSDSTASDREENDGKCQVCLKYEFMVPLLKSHICRFVDKKCPDCSEVLHWITCYKNHIESHDTKDIVAKIKEENSSDSTVSDNEELEKLLSPIKTFQCEKCQICLKYQGMFIILEENHMCDVEKPNRNCEKCNEIIHWYSCFEKHRKSHQIIKTNLTVDVPSNKFLQFGRNFDCGICLKLNSIVTTLVKNHKCADKKLCTVCNEVSYWLSCLKNHKQSETVSEFSDGEDVEAFKSLGQHTDCAVCSKFRATIVNLRDHVCRQRKGNQKCKTCVELSFWLKSFKAHEKHHVNEVPSLGKFLSCPRCGKRFSGEKMLDVHESYCKSSNFTCDICDRKFVNMFFLKKHKIFQLCRRSAISVQNKDFEKTFSNSSDCNKHDCFHIKCAKRVDFKSEIF